MNRYVIVHTDTYGEKHQLKGSWEAITENDAIDMMMRESGAEDDGRWEAHLIRFPWEVID